MLKDLLVAREPITTSDLAGKYGLTQRSIRYDLEEISGVCVEYSLDLVHSRAGIWLNGDEPQKTCLRSELSRLHPEDTDPNHRLHRLLAVLLTADQPVVVKQVQDVLGVSPRTVYADMDKAESWLCNLGLQLIRKPHFGAKVQGAELQVRQACFTLITTIGQRSHSSMSSMHPEDLIQSFHEQTDGFLFETLIDASDIEQVMTALATCKDTPTTTQFPWPDLPLYLAMQVKRIRHQKTVLFSKANLKQLQDTNEFHVAANIAQRLYETTHVAFSDEEIAFITLFLLGVYSNRVPVVDMEEQDTFVVDIVSRMLVAVDETLGLVLSTDKDLFQGLVLHVKPMVYRLMHGIAVQNDMLDVIQSDHALAYYAAVVAGRCIESVVGRSPSAAEIGFIALHLGAALERRRVQPIPVGTQSRVLVVCASGIGTGKILRSRIESSFVNLRVVRVVDATSVYHARADEADIIVSTVPLGAVPLPHIVVNPLLPAADRERINHWITTVDSGCEMVPAVQLAKAPVKQVLEHYFVFAKPDVVDQELNRMLSRLNSYLTVRRDVTPVATDSPTDRKKVYRMYDLLTEETVRVQCHANAREEVVESAGRLLVHSGAVQPKYIDAMKCSLNTNGPYMVIVPGVAILHARPEDGVNRVCMSLVTLGKGVRFGHKDNDPVDVAIAFGAVDRHRHVEALADLMRLLSDEGSMLAIRHAKRVQDVLDVIAKVLS
ncbi:BglG family transcription antiterminator [Alicyclobacillus fastidiosus]